MYGLQYFPSSYSKWFVPYDTTPVPVEELHGHFATYLNALRPVRLFVVADLDGGDGDHADDDDDDDDAADDDDDHADDDDDHADDHDDDADDHDDDDADDDDHDDDPCCCSS